MALDPSKIDFQDDGLYSAGQIDFKVDTFRRVTVCVLENVPDAIVSSDTKRPSLVRHAGELMRAALGNKDGLSIDVAADVELRHCGLGSSSNTIAAIGYAINELYGNPLDKMQLASYLARNHGEEIDESPGLLSPVQCIGGSALAGIVDGGVFVVAGAQKVIAQRDVPATYEIIVGIPSGFKHPDANFLLEEEARNMSKFILTGEKYGPTIAYRLIHECLPELTTGNLNPLGELIFDYRFRMGSIQNCSFVYPPMVEIAKELESLKQNGDALILSLSSVGPGFFAVTDRPSACIEKFTSLGLVVHRLRPYNGQYQVSYGK